MSKKHIVRLAVTAGLILQTAASCVKINEGLGSNFIPEDRRYAVRSATFPLTRIKVGLADNLSGYSSNRITVGAIKTADDWATYGSAFTLIPLNDAIDFGKEGTMDNIRFHFTAVRDTFSVQDADQMNIIQNIYVYKLTKPLDKDYVYIGGDEPAFKEEGAAPELITEGIPTYNGGDSLSFDFKKEFAEHVVETIRGMEKETYSDLEKYAEKLPGIYITSQRNGIEDAPVSQGGRINMFGLTLQISESYYVTGNYAELAFTADYGDRTQVDTSFLFYFGPQKRTTSTTQYALNISRNSSKAPAGAEDKSSWDLGTGDFVVEGGAGLKPVISSAEIKKLITDELKSQKIDPNTVIINKATVVLPYEWEYEDYDKSYKVPQTLNPTSRISGTTKDEDGKETQYVTYAGLTDASIETENQGNVDRSLKRYAPDISHHVQTIMKLPGKDAEPEDYYDEDVALSKEGDEGYDKDASEAQAKKFEDYDIWMLIMASETITKNQDNSAYNDYYQNLAYANYYNSMYDPYGYGGYGGYGYGGYGYGSYGYGYNNYYNYLALSQMYSNSGSSTSTVTQLDKDRYYRCNLAEPMKTDDWEKIKEKGEKEKKEAIGKFPHLKIIYSYIIPTEE